MKAAFVALVLLYIVAGVWTTRRIAATGDEVTYFMAADALVRGEGLDLTARWLAIDTASYSPGDPIPADEFARTTAPSRAREGAFPIHDLGLPLLIAGPFALGGRALVVALIGLAMACAIAFGFRVAKAYAFSRRAFAGTAATALTVPAITYSGQVFADSIAPLAVGTALMAVVGVAPRWAFSVALATLPVLHVRYWPIVLGLALLGATTWRPGIRDAAKLLAPLAVVVVTISAIDLAIYGIPLPHAGFLLFFADRRAPIETYAGAWGIAGLFVDRAFGLIPAAPIAMLLFLGAGSLLRHTNERLLVLAFLPYLVIVPFVDWTGGFSPQARYFAPLLPLFPLLFARAFAFPWIRILSIPLVVWTIGQSAVYVVAPWLRYDAFGIPPLSDRAWSNVVPFTPSALFPQFGTEGALVGVAFWCAVLCAMVGIGLNLALCSQNKCAK